MGPIPEAESVRRSESAPLAPFTTFGIGGPATELVEIGSGSRLAAVAAEVGPDAELHLIGGGSNLVVSDEGLSGTTVVLRGARPNGALQADSDGLVSLDGAWDWSSVASELAQAGIQGVESMCGIPGTVGGAVVQNIGAYGYELAEIVHEVQAFDRQEGRTIALAAADCGFGYRTSRFKAFESGRYLIIGVTLKLTPGGRHEVRYEELGLELGEGKRSLIPADVCGAVLAIRERKSMVYRPGDPLTRGVGSFFTNPVVTREEYESLASSLPTGVPRWPTDDGVKLSGGWLIEQAGFPRGYRAGNVAISGKHALAILNLTGTATAGEVIEFAGAIRTGVYKAHGVLLTPEPVFLGFPAGDPWA